MLMSRRGTILVLLRDSVKLRSRSAKKARTRKETELYANTRLPSSDFDFIINNIDTLLLLLGFRRAQQTDLNRRSITVEDSLPVDSYD